MKDLDCLYPDDMSYQCDCVDCYVNYINELEKKIKRLERSDNSKSTQCIYCGEPGKLIAVCNHCLDEIGD